MCPMYAKKTEELNIRNPDNLLQYYPTLESWTWTLNDRPHANYEPTPTHELTITKEPTIHNTQHNKQTHTS